MKCKSLYFLCVCVHLVSSLTALSWQFMWAWMVVWFCDKLISCVTPPSAPRQQFSQMTFSVAQTYRYITNFGQSTSDILETRVFSVVFVPLVCFKLTRHHQVYVQFNNNMLIMSLRIQKLFLGELVQYVHIPNNIAHTHKLQQTLFCPCSC